MSETSPDRLHPTSTAWKIIPHFRSTDIERTVAFYRKHLGFGVGSIHHVNTPRPTHCSIYIGEKAAANIYFYLAGSDTSDPGLDCGSVHLALRRPALEELYERIQRNNAAAEQDEDKVTIVYPIGDKDWGYKEFTMEDPDGNRITFFRFLEGE